MSLGRQEIVVSKEWISRFTEVLEDSNALWQDTAAAESGPYGGMVAPPSFIYGFYVSGKPFGVFRVPFEAPSPPIDGGADWEFLDPVRPGDVSTLDTSIADIYERTGKGGPMLFVIFELIYTNQEGKLVCRCRKTNICR